MLVDTHSHVSFPQYDADRDAVVGRAIEASVEQIIDVGCDVASSGRSIEFARACPKGRVFATVGLHPHQASELGEDGRSRLGELARGAPDVVVAIGECGLDYYYDRSPRDQQRHAFREQLELAWEIGLPAVLHIRDAHDEALAILEGMAGDSPLPEKPFRGVSHCYSGNAEQAARYWKLGFHVAFGGVITFKSADALREAAAAVPIEQIVLETDCPYMAPAPKRGKRNEPALVVHVAERLADVRGIPVEEVHRVTTATARSLFGLPEPVAAGGEGATR